VQMLLGQLYMQGLRGVGRDFKVQIGLLYCAVISI